MTVAAALLACAVLASSSLGGQRPDGTAGRVFDGKFNKHSSTYSMTITVSDAGDNIFSLEGLAPGRCRVPGRKYSSPVHFYTWAKSFKIGEDGRFRFTFKKSTSSVRMYIKARGEFVGSRATGSVKTHYTMGGEKCRGSGKFTVRQKS